MQVEKGFLDSGFFKQPNADNIIDANASASSLPYKKKFVLPKHDPNRNWSGFRKFNTYRDKMCNHILWALAYLCW